MRLTLRTLLAYLDDTLPPAEALAIGRKVAESDHARELVEKIKKLPRKRSLAVPTGGKDDSPSNPNTVAEYLSDALGSDAVTEFETACLDQEVNLAEVAACHQILTLLLSEPARVPPTARKRMYELVKGPASLPNRKPGLTIPVGGIPSGSLPNDAKEEDGSGRTAFSPSSVGIRVLAAAMLAALALGAAWLAWPRDPAPIAVLTKDVAEPASKPVPPPGEIRESIPEPDPAVTSKPEEKMPEAVPVPVPEDKKEPTPKPDPLAIDGREKVVGVITSKDALLVAETNPGMWTRLPAGGTVTSGERIVTFPGFKAAVRLETNVIVDLWANVPDQVPGGPLGSAVTFHPPAADVAADLTLHSGRLYLSTTAPDGATVRVRTPQGIREIRLADPSSEAAVERTCGLSRGLTPKAAEPSFSLDSFACTRGLVTMTRPPTRMAALTLKAGEGLCESSTVTLTPAEVGKRLARTTVYPDAITASAAQKGLAGLAAAFGPESRVSVALAESAAGPSVPVARAAVFAQGAVGELGEIVSELLDPSRPPVRDAAATALRAYLAENPDRISQVVEWLTGKAGFTNEQAGTVLSLLRGPDETEERSPVVLNRLVDGLTADTLPVRELSHRTLILDIDPEAVRIPGLVRYDATGSVEARESCQKLWRQRIAELLK